QRPPPQIVACGLPARRSSEHGLQLGIRLQAHIGTGQCRPYQGKAGCELLQLFPMDSAVLTPPTSGLPPELLGASGDTQEPLDVSRSPVRVVVAAQVWMAGLLLLLSGRMQPGSDEPWHGLCRSLEACALSPS